MGAGPRGMERIDTDSKMPPIPSRRLRPGVISLKCAKVPKVESYRFRLDAQIDFKDIK